MPQSLRVTARPCALGACDVLFSNSSSNISVGPYWEIEEASSTVSETWVLHAK